MDSRITDSLLHNWPRKAVAIGTALIIWFFVNASIIETKTVPNVPIRVVNLPPSKTIIGLQPNHLLSRHVTLTLSGSKDLIRDIEPGDLEVVLDASSVDHDEWAVQITKKNLVSLNPAIDLNRHISDVKYTEFMLKVSPLKTERILIKILPPEGNAPSGYEFLDIWPQKLVQTITGAQEEIEQIKARGIEFTINLSEVSKTDLDSLKPVQGVNHEDEVSYTLPIGMKKIRFVCQTGHVEEPINDPEAQSLHIDFLRKIYLPLNKEIPIRAFYPLQYLDTLNKKTYPLATSQWIYKKYDRYYLTMPLYVNNVSRLFLSTISDYLEITIYAAPKSAREWLSWGLEILNIRDLEDLYVAQLMTDATGSSGNIRRREALLRNRFREYAQRLALYAAPANHKLHLESFLGNDTIEVKLIK